MGWFSFFFPFVFFVRALTLSLCLAGLMALSPSVRADNILIVNDHTYGNITAVLQTTCFPSSGPDTVATFSAPPSDLTGYDQIWDLRASSNLSFTAAEKTAYTTFLQSGGRMFVMGENSLYMIHNNSILSLVDALGGGALTFTSAFSGSGPYPLQTIEPPYNSTPNNIATITYASAGGVTSPGTGSWITHAGTLGGSAVMWPTGTLNNAPAGSFALVFDVNFMTAPPADGSNPQFLQNLCAAVKTGGNPEVPPPLCTATPNPAQPSDGVAISCQVDAGTVTTIPGATCDAPPTGSTGLVTIACTGTGATLGNNPPATSIDPLTGSASTWTVPLQITQTSDQTPPIVPVCSAPPVASGATVTITCTGGTPGATLIIPNTTCAPATLNASGGATCTGTAGTGTGQVHNNPPVTVTADGLSNSGTVAFQMTGSTHPPLPACTATPNPAGMGTLVSISCIGGPPNGTLVIPGSSCAPTTLDGSGATTCTGVGSDLGNNPQVTVTDTGSNTINGTVPLTVITALPTTPVCTATPNPTRPNQNVAVSCTVDPGSVTAIPGATCPTTPATGTSIVCNGTGASLGNNPPVISTDAGGNTSNGMLPLQITQGGPGSSVPPVVPVCSAPPVASGATVTITCTGGTPGATLSIPGTSNCNTVLLDASGNATCHGTAGTGAGQIHNNPPVTVTANGLSNSGTVAFQMTGSTSNPSLPVCTATPNPAGGGQVVTITCTGGPAGGAINIPSTTDCASGSFDGTGTAVCYGMGSKLGSNPPVTVTDTGGNSTKGTVPLSVNLVPPAAPVCTATPNSAQPDDNVTIICTVDAGTVNTIPGSNCTNAAPTGTPPQISCAGTGKTLGDNPPVTSTNALDISNTGSVPLTIVLPSDAPLPPVPRCTANPNPADLGATVTITCTGGLANGVINIPGTDCAPGALDASGNATCHGTAGTGAGQMHNDPRVTVTDPGTGQSNSGIVPLRIRGTTTTPPLPNCTANPNPVPSDQTVTITCQNGRPGDQIIIANTDCAQATFNSSGQAICKGLGGAIGPNPPLIVSDPTTGVSAQGTVPMGVGPAARGGGGGAKTAASIPTLNEWGRLALLVLLSGLVLARLRRKART
ncbi:MAG: hypothetical protein LBI16_04360 [Burkholderiales bacterium]|nr:hypothetical protein [Burkholderiales bacterium]